MTDAFASERASRLAIVIAAEAEIELATRLALASLLAEIAKDYLPIVAAPRHEEHGRNRVNALWLSLSSKINATITKLFRNRFLGTGAPRRSLNIPETTFSNGVLEHLKGIPDEIYTDLDRIIRDNPNVAVRELLNEQLTPGHDDYDKRLDAMASRVARTSAIAAFNGGDSAGFLAIQQVDLHGTSHKVTKRWLSSHDDKVRPTHVHADDDPDNQAVPVDGFFSVGGFQARYPGDWTLPASEAVNCRCTALYSMNGEPVTDPIVSAVVDDTQTPDIEPVETGTYASDGTLPDGWRGPIASLDVPTSDRRMLATPKDGKIKSRAYPLTLTRNHVGDPTGYPTIGSVDNVWMQDNMLFGEGRFDLGGEDGQHAARQLAGGFLNRVSIDPVEVSAENRAYSADGALLDLADGDALPEGAYTVTTFTDWTLAGLAMVPIPAYTDAAVEPVYGYMPTVDLENPAVVSAVDEAALAKKKHKLTAPDRGYLKAMIAHHHQGIGIARGFIGFGGLSQPVQEAAEGSVADQQEDANEAQGMVDADDAAPAAPAGGSMEIVAAVGGQVFNPKFFADPSLSEPTPLTVTEDGHVFGHVRLAGTCYQYGGGQGNGGFCLEPPASACGYAKFMVHSAMMDDGSIKAVGALTFGDGHESRGSLAASQAHYNNVATIAAKGIVGDDEFGVWFSGEVTDNAKDKAYDLLLSPMSGHWEPDSDSGHLELMAIHIVVTPGYTVRRIVAGFDEAGAPNSLIITTYPEVPLIQTISQEAAPAMTETPSARSAVVAALNDLKRAEVLAKKIGIDTDSRLARANDRIALAESIIAASSGGGHIAPTSTPWDGPAAAASIFAHATKNGKIDVGMASQGFLAHIGDGSKKGDWKLPFARVVGGVIQIVPRGVSAAAGRLDQTQGIDQAAVKSKIAGLYSRIHKADPTWPAAPPM